MQLEHGKCFFRQIESDLRGKINSGIYKPEDKIPTEPELMRFYQASITTLRRAIAELCRQGYLVKHQGRGTFVLRRIVKIALVSPHINSSWMPMYDTLRQVGLTLGFRIQAYPCTWSSIPEYLGALRSASQENDAVILFPPYAEDPVFAEHAGELARGGYPLLIIEKPDLARRLDLPCVAVDYHAGFKKLFAGTRSPPGRTAVLLDPLHPTASALENISSEFGVPPGNIRRLGMSDRPALYRALDELFFAGARPQALVCFSSSPAIAAALYLMSRGLRPAADFTLAAAGNTGDLADLQVPLLALELPRQAMGRHAGELIHAMLAGKPANRRIYLAPKTVRLNQATKLTA